MESADTGIENEYIIFKIDVFFHGISIDGLRGTHKRGVYGHIRTARRAAPPRAKDDNNGSRTRRIFAF
ncbi:hypothetical protein AGMMS49991_10720 [Spirochaetia bacterium]|nr:hypothetical protein AGMMS49991_10720 [Spirochaetia bacterium]